MSTPAEYDPILVEAVALAHQRVEFQREPRVGGRAEEGEHDPAPGRDREIEGAVRDQRRAEPRHGIAQNDAVRARLRVVHGGAFGCRPPVKAGHAVSFAVMVNFVLTSGFHSATPLLRIGAPAIDSPHDAPSPGSGPREHLAAAGVAKPAHRSARRHAGARPRRDRSAGRARRPVAGGRARTSGPRPTISNCCGAGRPISPRSTISAPSCSRPAIAKRRARCSARRCGIIPTTRWGTSISAICLFHLDEHDEARRHFEAALAARSGPCSCPSRHGQSSGRNRRCGGRPPASRQGVRRQFSDAAAVPRRRPPDFGPAAGVRASAAIFRPAPSSTTANSRPRCW